MMFRASCSADPRNETRSSYASETPMSAAAGIVVIEIATPKFSLGKLIATPSAIEALADAKQTPIEFVARHIRGDWGDACDEDRQANEDALRNGGRLLSVYRTAKGLKLWIITEADRSITTILLPEEY